ncbi:MAG: glycosyltransferase [Methanobrevibacter woesei]|uniref:glycosyltransferase family 2 protein n=1 Tax=Methanobrevibacter woesei TaxID=190976 RepID=UPI0023F0D5C1|nr:glycosyltransferase [Methanobrevibacter woesei]MCI7292089.1 glycosyltransferase [Methanobrevibacter woesei]
MTSNVKVSVIVPVYNVEKYLRDCLDSIVNQTLEDIEIICVNDGSTDNSLAILEDYAEKDSRIRIINQENKGLGGARNTGLYNANGEYISFIDSDDWIEPNTFEESYNMSKDLDLDMLMFQMKFFNMETEEYSENQNTNIEVIDNSFSGTVFNYKDVFDVLFKIPHNSVNKLYKYSFLKDMKFKFLEGAYYEDLASFFPLFLEAKKVSILKKQFYIYRIRSESITTSGDEGSFDMFNILKDLQKLLKDKNIYPQCMQEFLMFIIVNLKFVYLRLANAHKNNFLQAMKENYEALELDNVSEEHLMKWHYEDRCFYQSIKKSKDSYDFDLIFKCSCNEFLVNHYEGLVNQLKIQNQNLLNEINQLKNNNSSVKSKFKNIFRS